MWSRVAVAIKVEPALSPSHSSPLIQESRVYRSLMGGEGVPWLMWSGRHSGYNVMIIDLLGPSLDDLFKMCNRSFGLKTVLQLADQILTRLEYVHSRGLVHRDVKPANFVMSTPHPSAHAYGHAHSHEHPNPHRAHTLPRRRSSPLLSQTQQPPQSLVNVIDFGLAAKFRPSRPPHHHRSSSSPSRSPPSPSSSSSNPSPTNSPRRPSLGPRAATSGGAAAGAKGGGGGATPAHGVGTPLFASLPTHHNQPPSRRDDLESLAYMLVYFLRGGSLPWRKTRGGNIGETWELIRQKKLESRTTLCVGLPLEFDLLYKYATNLGHGDEPDYEGLRAMFRALAGRKGVEYDGEYDWSVEGPSWSKGVGVGGGRGDGRGRRCVACERRRAAASES